MKEEYETIREAGAKVIAVSSDSLESHQRFCRALGGCPFPLVSDQDLEATRQSASGGLGEDGHRSPPQAEAVIIIDQGVRPRRMLHQIPWFQPGNPPAADQFMEIFRALGAM